MRIDDLVRAVQNYVNATNAKMLLISIVEQGGLTEKERHPDALSEDDLNRIAAECEQLDMIKLGDNK